MNYWLLKTEPGDYSFADLVREKRAVWDGVANNWALKFMREMRCGDRAFIYHTGKDKHLAGIAEVVREAYPDPDANDDRRLVVDVQAVERLPQPVPLAAIKQDEAFAEFLLVKMSRLSVMPVTAAHWRRLCNMGQP